MRPRHKLVAIGLANAHDDTTNLSISTVEALAEFTGMSTEGVLRTLDEMVAENLIAPVPPEASEDVAMLYQHVREGRRRIVYALDGMGRAA